MFFFSSRAAGAQGRLAASDRRAKATRRGGESPGRGTQLHHAHRTSSCLFISGPPPVGLPLRQKAKGAAALEGRAGVEWGVLAALAAWRCALAATAAAAAAAAAAAVVFAAACCCLCRWTSWWQARRARIWRTPSRGGRRDGHQLRQQRRQGEEGERRHMTRGRAPLQGQAERHEQVDRMGRRCRHGSFPQKINSSCGCAWIARLLCGHFASATGEKKCFF